MLTNRLCNPTPFLVKWNWHAGINIVIPPDSHVDLSNEQMKDFQPNQPGSEAITQLMNELGVFLRDTDRTYEAQALEALNASYRAKRSHYNESTNSIRAARAEKGIVDNPEALEETFRQMGLSRLREQVERLQHRINQFSKEVETQGASAAVNKLDPDRTLIFTTPPKVFETKFALQVFLSEPENAELKAKYEAWRKALDK